MGRGAAVAQDWAKRFYNSPSWLKNRKNYLMRVLDTPLGPCPAGMCERCFERGELVPAVVVHHKVHLTPENIGDPHYTLSYDNLQRLCVDCHAAVHSAMDEPRVTFDADGNIVPTSADSFEARVISLTESVDEKRNIHRRAR